MTGITRDSRTLALVVVLSCVTLGLLAGSPGTVAANHANTSVTFDDQTADQSGGVTTVVVSNVTLKNDGYVVIHNESFTPGYYNLSGSIIGVSDYLTPGNHRNVTVELYTDVPGRTFDKEMLTEDMTLTAGVYGETNTSSGNTTFNWITHEGVRDETGIRDGRYTDDSENPTIINDSALVTVPETGDDSGDDGGSDDGGDDDGSDDGGDDDSGSDGEADDVEAVQAENASVTYTDQQATDAVTVESATLPDGGFVAVYNASGGVVGTTDVLDAGTHENITVEVSPAFDRGGVSFVRLYRDNGSTGTFNATTDATYNTSTGSTVSSTAYITVESNNTSTTTEAETTETTAAATTAETAAAETTEPGTTTGSTPGFTAGLAVVALGAAALVALRRQ